VVGHLALRHGDSVGLVAAPVVTARNAGRVHFVPAGRGDAHLERVLRAVHDAVDPDGGDSDLGAMLDYVARHFRRRLILVIVADDVALSERHAA
ncbi:DUF58 domain-containing protein, partial [Staphylococcus aureus]|uniref:DUF58 domain-containing protein n=1 Tax=Staphylococcus aureus TaxID=1280 RepID=UPI0019EA34A7